MTTIGGLTKQQRQDFAFVTSDVDAIHPWLHMLLDDRLGHPIVGQVLRQIQSKETEEVACAGFGLLNQTILPRQNRCHAAKILHKVGEKEDRHKNTRLLWRST